MSKLNLTFVVRNGKTCTKIGKKNGAEEIVFRNKGAANLVIDFDADLLVNEKVDPNKFVRKLTLLPGATSDGIRLHSNAKVDQEVKYTAQIGTSTQEDPIIIVD